MAICNKKMNLTGTLRCELEEHDDNVACYVQVVKNRKVTDPKGARKLLRSAHLTVGIVAIEAKEKVTGVTKTKPVTACNTFLMDTVLRKNKHEERIMFLLDVIDSRGKATLSEINELGELGAVDRLLSLLEALPGNEMYIEAINNNLAVHASK